MSGSGTAGPAYGTAGCSSRCWLAEVLAVPAAPTDEARVVVAAYHVGAEVAARDRHVLGAALRAGQGLLAGPAVALDHWPPVFGGGVVVLGRWNVPGTCLQAPADRVRAVSFDQVVDLRPEATVVDERGRALGPVGALCLLSHRVVDVVVEVLRFYFPVFRQAHKVGHSRRTSTVVDHLDVARETAVDAHRGDPRRPREAVAGPDDVGLGPGAHRALAIALLLHGLDLPLRRLGPGAAHPLRHLTVRVVLVGQHGPRRAVLGTDELGRHEVALQVEQGRELCSAPGLGYLRR